MGGHGLHRAVTHAIVAATSADRDAVVALWRACGLTRPWNDANADFDRAIGAHDTTVLLCRKADAVVATVMIGWDGHRGWVYYLAVAEAERRSGLGRALMNAAEEWLRARGCPKIQPMIRDDNADALRFYEALGLARQPVVTMGRFLNGDAM